jgi:hypothetical protein
MPVKGDTSLHKIQAAYGGMYSRDGKNSTLANCEISKIVDENKIKEKTEGK